MKFISALLLSVVFYFKSHILTVEPSTTQLPIYNSMNLKNRIIKFETAKQNAVKKVRIFPNTDNNFPATTGKFIGIGIAIGIASMVGLAIIGGGVYFFVNNTREDNEQEDAGLLNQSESVSELSEDD